MMDFFVVFRCVQCVCAVSILAGMAFAKSLPERQKRVCRPDDFLQIQKTCRKENDDLLLAEKAHDDGMVCKELVDLFYCVAGNVPLCFHNLTTTYVNYFHSPHNCVLSPQQIISLQNLTAHSAHNQGERPEDVDVEVDIIVPVTTPSVETSSEEEEEEGEVEDGGGGEVGGMRQEEQSGLDGHTGSGASGRSHYTNALLVTSTWLGAWRMTSYLLS